MIFTLMPLIFLIGIICVALEDVIRINKTVTVLFMSIVLWGLFLIDSEVLSDRFTAISPFSGELPHFLQMSVTERFSEIGSILSHSLGEVAETMFFIMGSMVLIELIDAHDAFSMVAQWVHVKRKRPLLWFVAGWTFFLSAIIGNLAAIMVMLAIVSKILKKRPDRLLFACIMVVAANAGGSWSPIGDVTTLLLWTGGNIGMTQQVLHVFLPALCMLLIPLIAATFMLEDGPTRELNPEVDLRLNVLGRHTSKRYRIILLVITLLTFVSVPVLQTIIGLPPFMSVFIGLVIMWAMTDLRYGHRKNNTYQGLRIGSAFGRIDISTVLYFLGILMSVDALKTAGQLDLLAGTFDRLLPNPESIALMFGIFSSFLDNVALVAAGIGMYPIASAGPFMADGVFWTFLAYCGVTGGSLLVIGSAAGITAMGLEQIPFTYYLKKITPWALLSYFVGAGVFLLLI